MIKSELIIRLAQKTNLSKSDAKKAVDTIFETIINTLAQG